MQWRRIEIIIVVKFYSMELNPKYEQRICIEEFREILGCSGGVNTIIIIAFYSMFFSYNQAIQLNPKDNIVHGTTKDLH